MTFKRSMDTKLPIVKCGVKLFLNLETSTVQLLKLRNGEIMASVFIAHFIAHGFTFPCMFGLKIIHDSKRGLWCPLCDEPLSKSIMIYFANAYVRRCPPRLHYQFIPPWTKWPPFRRRYFQMHFHLCKVFIFWLKLHLIFSRKVQLTRT